MKGQCANIFLWQWFVPDHFGSAIITMVIMLVINYNGYYKRLPKNNNYITIV